VDERRMASEGDGSKKIEDITGKLEEENLKKLSEENIGTANGLLQGTCEVEQKVKKTQC
jgi:hypothetical protein